MRISWILLLLVAFALASPCEESESPRRELKLALFPAFGWMPETRAIGGAYLQGILKGDSLTHDGQIAFYGVATQNKQAELGFIPEIWWKQNRWMSRFEVSYQNWPSETYGIGIDSREEDESSFISENLKMEFLLRRELAPGFYTGLYAIYRQESFLDPGDGFLWLAEDGRDAGLGLDLSYDTRLSTLLPGSGMYHQVRLIRHAGWSGHVRTRLLADLRMYHNPGPIQLATQLAFDHTHGDAGFRQMAELGEYLRAYGDTRFIDRSLAAFRVEARRHLFWRFGAVAFLETGTVAPGLPDLADSEWKFSPGLGGRFQLIEGEDLNLRLDAAFGDEGLAIYLRLGEEF